MRKPPVWTEKRNGLTYGRWLSQGPIPAGFDSWSLAICHWDQGNDLGWAIYCFKKTLADPMRWPALED